MQKQVTELFDLNDQCVLVTGANGTIGAATADRLAQAGATVIMHYRSSHNKIDELLSTHGAKSMSVQADLQFPEQIVSMLNDISTAGFKLTAIVNNAADQTVSSLAELSLEQWQQTQQLNVNAIFYLTQQACQQFPLASVVNISSIEGLDGAAGHGHYATSKAALNMLTRSFALEYGKNALRVNTISPGLIHRDGIEQAWPEGVQNWQSRAPLTRLGSGQDIADAVLFLISDASSWISGTNLVVDGGMSCQPRW